MHLVEVFEVGYNMSKGEVMEGARYSEHVYQEYVCGTHVEPIHQREDIVRCKDCVHADNDGYGCWYFGHILLNDEGMRRFVPGEVTPEGFCKWGILRAIFYRGETPEDAVSKADRG